jgi:hypothetical protein
MVVVREMRKREHGEREEAVLGNDVYVGDHPLDAILCLYTITTSNTQNSQVSSINRVLRTLQEDHRLHWAQLRSPGAS